MNPLDDDASIDSLEIGQSSLGGSDDEPPRRDSDRGVWLWILICLVAAAVALYIFWWRPQQGVETAEEPPASSTTSASQESPNELDATGADVALPELDASDAVVRQLLETLTDHPSLATLLVPDSLVRRFVASVDNIADGVSPRPHVGFLQPSTGFHTRLEGPRLIATDDTYERYDRWTELLESVDPAKAAYLYTRLEPLFQSAYSELGYPNDRFLDTLLRAIDRLSSAPTVPEGAELVANVSSYGYRNPAYEQLGEVEKHLARMGPENARRVQAHLEKVRAELVADRADGAESETPGGDGSDSPDEVSESEG